MQKELFYVAASRGRHSVTVITSDKERLQETVGRSMARRSASELVRGISAARKMVRSAAEFFEQVVVKPRKERARERGLGR
jgi:predicted RNA-binding protein with PIN domain